MAIPSKQVRNTRYITSSQLNTLHRQKISSLVEFQAWCKLPKRGKPMKPEVKQLLEYLFDALDTGNHGYKIVPSIDYPDMSENQISSMITGCYSFFERMVEGYWISRSKGSDQNGQITISLILNPSSNVAHGHRKSYSRK